MKGKYISTTFHHYLNENMINQYDDFFVEYIDDRIVYHITSKRVESIILQNGFETGYELNVAEKRKAIYFADIDVNYGIYARNENEGDAYYGEEIGEVPVNIKGLKLLNLSYKVDGNFVNHKKYNNFSVRGELDKIPFDIDGTISFLEDGRIFEVALKKDVANALLQL
jgi:hypothetical protein